MKYFSKKKITIGTIIACLFIGTIEILGSKVKPSEEVTLAKNQYEENEKKDKVQMEPENKAVKEFENGFKFVGINTGIEVTDKEEDKKEADKKEERATRLSMQYVRADETMMFYVQELPTGETEESIWKTQKGVDRIFEYDGIKLMYKNSRYLCVTPDYVQSEQDRKDQESGELSIGVDSVGGVDRQAYSIMWIIGDEMSSLFGFDLGLLPEEMFEMAKEMIDTQLTSST